MATAWEGAARVTNLTTGSAEGVAMTVAMAGLGPELLGLRHDSGHRASETSRKTLLTDRQTGETMIATAVHFSHGGSNIL